MQPVEKDLSPVHSFWNILLRRGWYIIACLIAVLGPIAIYNRTATPTYEAITTIIYEKSRLPISAANPFEYAGKESLLNHIQEIKSRSVALEVVSELPQEVLKEMPLPKKTNEKFDRRTFYAAKIRKNIQASPAAESDIIQIKVRANDNYAAMVIANTVCDVLEKRNLRIRQQEVSGVRSFIEEQRENYSNKLEEAESALRDFKEVNRVTSLDKEVEEVLRRITQIDALYQETKANLNKTQERLKTVIEKIASQRQTLVPSITDVSTPLVQQLKEDLKNLQADLIRMTLQGVPDSNPKLQSMRADMERIRNELTAEAIKIAAMDNVIDPLSQMSLLFEEKFNLELEIETLRTQQESLASTVDNYEAKLRNLPSKEYQLARLTREKELANSIFIMLSQRREEARISEAEKLGNMRVIDRAELPRSPIYPKKRLNLAIGMVLGLTMGLGLAFFMETLDVSIKTPDEVEKKTGLTILGSIPNLKSRARETVAEEYEDRSYREPSRQLITYAAPASPASEAYRTLRTNLQFSNLAENFRIVLLTSSGPREGKSTTVANLAVATAQMGLRTLVIDADLRKPTIHRFFGLHREPGLANILSYFFHKSQFRSFNGVVVREDDEDIESSKGPMGQASVKAKKTVQDIASLDLALSEAVQPTNIRGLDVLTCGELPSNPSEMLASETMKDLLVLVKERYDFVIIDAPPVIAVTDAAVLAPIVDGVALVLESGRNDKEIIQKAKSLLSRGGVNLLGAILNNVKERNLYGDYNYYYTYYSQKEELQANPRKRKVNKPKSHGTT
ncbi:hypothetical protein A2V82_02610 [candidate division KSB1 bacterium RBG_16_48_16]|nr:MAG: hypothetical protein A2V82_02610 [candidate division KSB1 bacterium RBG_16_48_16]